MTDDDRIVVKPRTAAAMLGCGITRLYELIAACEIESFKDGRSRKITTASIRDYVARRLVPTVEGTRNRRSQSRKSRAVATTA